MPSWQTSTSSGCSTIASGRASPWSAPAAATCGRSAAHGKLLIVDDDAAVIGSLALSARALDGRRELAVVTRDRRAGGRTGHLLARLSGPAPSRGGRAAPRRQPGGGVVRCILGRAAATAWRLQLWRPRTSRRRRRKRCALATRCDSRRPRALDTDVRRADASRDDDVDVDLARRRVGVTGRVTSHVEFEVEREIDDGGRWRDVFVNVRANREIQVPRRTLQGAVQPRTAHRRRRPRLHRPLARGRSAGARTQCGRRAARPHRGRAVSATTWRLRTRRHAQRPRGLGRPTEPDAGDARVPSDRARDARRRVGHEPRDRRRRRPSPSSPRAAPRCAAGSPPTTSSSRQCS